MNRLFAILLLALPLMSSVAFAGPAAVVLGTPFAHDGLFANASMGLGYASFENADGEESLTADGFGMRLHGKLGYFVVQDLALHANMGYVMYSNFQEARQGLSMYVDHDFYVLSSVFVGAGATYYIPEWNNVFVSGALGITGYRLNCHKFSGNTGLRAFSFDVEVGKDWWVREHLAFGASLAFNSGEYWSDDDGVFRSSSLMLMFSVSFN
jgi:hypothetical protein